MGLLARYLPRDAVDPNDIALMRRVGATMLIAGSGSAFVGVFTVQTTPFGQRSQAILAAILLLLGVAVLVARPTPILFRGAVLGSVTVISAMMATAQPISSTPLFYLWPVVFAAYFLGRRCAAAAVVWLTLTLAGALVVTTDDIVHSDILVSTVVTVGLIGVVVTGMRERERRLARRLTDAARTDALTGLLNRHGLEPELARHLGEAERSGVPLSIALFDLDHFKAFNDAHGHLEGDEALRRIGRLLRQCARAGDCVARFGGEEFAVVLPGATPDGGRAYADRVALALADEPVREELRLSISCGIAQWEPGQSVDVVVGRADEALYAAKYAGRRRSAWWRADRLITGTSLGPTELAALRAAASSPREYVVRMADRAREIEPESSLDLTGGTLDATWGRDPAGWERRA